MAQKARAYRKRLKGVSNTRKITKTMEMVATSRLKRAQDRVVAGGPYARRLADVMAAVRGGEIDLARFPLFERREPVKRVLVLVVTANRGLCGGFNANLIRKGREVLDAERAKGRAVVLYVTGRKGIAAFRYRGEPMARTFTDLPDRPTVADGERFAQVLAEPFLKREVDRVVVVYAHWASSGSQPPTATTLLPVGLGTDGATAIGARGPAATAPARTEDVLFEPSAEAILAELLPLHVRTAVYRFLVESVAAEQLARRVAMKLATENAEDMITRLTRDLNRARQAQITQEIAEILGGAEALK